MPSTNHRYKLRPYAGPSSRTICPACDKPRSFTRYLDTVTGELLPSEYGRCDRETKCGYHLGPYRIGANGTSYARQIRLEEKLGRPTYPQPSTVHVRPRCAPPAVVSIPTDVYRATLGHYERNALATLLRQHCGWGVADALLQRFQVGTSAHWPGACVFWLIDEQNRVRGGQVVLYDDTGHTVKNPRRCLTWAHTALVAHCQRLGRPVPVWLIDYVARGQKSPCLFGLSQLAVAPATQPIALVESAKTAIVATHYFPHYTWLATMGLSYLTPDRLEPLRGRRVVLWPDAGAFTAWRTKAAALLRLGFDVHISEALEKLVTEQERKNGFDLADVLLGEKPSHFPIWNNQQVFPS